MSDCVDAIITGCQHWKDKVEIYNIGSEDYINVKTIADIVTQEMGLSNVQYNFTGGVDGGRGWKGDVKTMLLSIDKLKGLNWKPKYSSAETVRMTAKALLGKQ